MLQNGKQSYETPVIKGCPESPNIFILDNEICREFATDVHRRPPHRGWRRQVYFDLRDRKARSDVNRHNICVNYYQVLVRITLK